MDWSFWGAIILVLAGWYCTVLFGAQLFQQQIADSDGTPADRSAEFLRLCIYGLLSVGLTTLGGYALYSI